MADHLSDAADVVVPVASVPGRSALNHVKFMYIFLAILFYKMPQEHTTEKMASVSGPFIKWNSRKTVKSEMSLPKSCLNPRAY